MPQWTYLSKKGLDEYIDRMAQGSGSPVTVLEQWQWTDDNNPLVLRGIMKHKIIKQCWQHGRPFRYIDTGYFGNLPSDVNPHGWKFWHRVVPNNLQHGEIIARPADRWRKLGIKLKPRQSGSSIVVAVPDDKPCKFYDVELDQWLAQTLKTIAEHTDRPVIVRQRNPDRTERKTKSLDKSLADVHAVVTFNSNAGTEAVIAGVPVFVLAPCHAAKPVGNVDLTRIDNPWWPDNDLREAWAHHLAYGQFHITEMQSGQAHRILDQTDQLKGPLWNSPL